MRWRHRRPPARRWLVPALVTLLLVGGVAGYGGTRVAGALASTGAPAAGAWLAGQPSGPGGAGTDPSPSPAPGTTAPPAASPAPGGSPGSGEPSGSGGPAVPSFSPPPGGAGGLCGQVAQVMLTMIAATTDPAASPESVVAAWRAAAGELRSLASQAPQPERAALQTLAGEIDTAAQAVAEHPGDQAQLQAEFGRVSDAYDRFRTGSC